MPAPPVPAQLAEASEWFARLTKRHVSAQDLQAFQVWRRTPLNAAAYAEVEQSSIRSQERATKSSDQAATGSKPAPKPTISWSAIPKPQSTFKMAGLMMVFAAGQAVDGRAPGPLIPIPHLEFHSAPLINAQLSKPARRAT